MFFIDFQINASARKMSLEDRILMMGSCFSENIGEYLKAYKFNVLVNPFGTIYNPVSIFKLLERSLKKEKDYQIIKNGDIYYDWNSHSRVSALNRPDLTNILNQKNEETFNTLKTAQWIIISPGTAWVYLLKGSDEIVANCHKVPQKEFDKRLLSVNEIIEGFDSVKSLIDEINKDIQWIFTISPVRHIRDGLVENNRSKSILMNSIHEIVDNHGNCHYFPSYEIVIDQLRDYRFYKEDMVHPGEPAIKYIWKRFIDTYFDETLIDFTKEWKKILHAIHHRSFHPTSPSHQKFIKETISKLERLANKVNTETEIANLKKQLI